MLLRALAPGDPVAGQFYAAGEVTGLCCPSARPAQTCTGTARTKCLKSKGHGQHMWNPRETPLGLLPAHRTGPGGPTGQAPRPSTQPGRLWHSDTSRRPGPFPLCPSSCSFPSAVVLSDNSAVAQGINHQHKRALTLGFRSEGWTAPTVGLGFPACSSRCCSIAFSTESSSKGFRNLSSSFSNHDLIYRGKEDFTFKYVKEFSSKTGGRRGMKEASDAAQGLAHSFRQMAFLVLMPTLPFTRTRLSNYTAAGATVKACL